jgi:hypothetical protein
MDGQLVVVALIVAGALFFMGRRAWRSLAASRKPKTGCGSDCGCS